MFFGQVPTEIFQSIYIYNFCLFTKDWKKMSHGLDPVKGVVTKKLVLWLGFWLQWGRRAPLQIQICELGLKQDRTPNGPLFGPTKPQTGIISYSCQEFRDSGI